MTPAIFACAVIFLVFLSGAALGKELGRIIGRREGQREPARRLAALLHHVETCPDCLLRMRDCGAPFVNAVTDATIEKARP